MNFELEISEMKLTIDLSRLSILSQTIQRRVEDEAAIPHFSSVTSKDLSPQHASGNPLSGFQNFAQLNSISDASSSKNTLPIQVISHQNQILKNLRAFLTLEKPDNGVMLLSRCWFGTGSLFGFDITLSISEIQVNFHSILYLLNIQSIFVPAALFFNQIWLPFFIATCTETNVTFVLTYVLL